MSRPTPRRPATSRGVTPRPRKIAGQDASPRSGTPVEPVELDESAEPVKESAGEPAPSISLLKRRLKPRSEPPTEPASDVEPDVELEVDSAQAADAPPDGIPVLARLRTTRILIGVLALMALVLAVQAGWWLLRDDSDPARAVDTPGGVAVPDDRPVVAEEVAVLDGVDAAARAAQELVAVDFNNFDAEVDKAAELMTDQFEKTYRATTSDIKQESVAQKTVVQANVVAQGVVRANRTRLQALIFLNQVVTRERDGKPETVLTPFKVLVTMVHTDQGWLVDGLDTDLPQDKNN